MDEFAGRERLFRAVNGALLLHMSSDWSLAPLAGPGIAVKPAFDISAKRATSLARSALCCEYLAFCSSAEHELQHESSGFEYLLWVRKEARGLVGGFAG
jgi:hypothetical protein